MRRFRVGTFSMGILLIAMGVILLLDKFLCFGAIKIIMLWWPIILILLGAEILFYVYSSKEAEPKIKYDGFSIFIVSVIIILSVGAYSVTMAIESIPEVRKLLNM